MKTLLVVGLAMFALSTAQASEVSCVLHTVTGPNQGLNPDGSIRRNTQTAEIKIIPREPGSNVGAGSVTLDDIKGSVYKLNDSYISMSIVKYNTSLAADIEQVKVPSKNEKSLLPPMEGTVLSLELPDNDHAWINCSEK